MLYTEAGELQLLRQARVQRQVDVEGTAFNASQACSISQMSDTTCILSQDSQPAADVGSVYALGRIKRRTLAAGTTACRLS